MAKPDPIDAGAPGAWHPLLLRVAGWVPDELLALARDRLAAGAVDEVARLVGSAAAWWRLPLWPDDVSRIVQALTGDRAAEPYLGDIHPAGHGGLPPLDLGSAPPDRAAADRARPGDEAVAGEAAELRAVAVFGVWRRSALGGAWPPPRRVHLVQLAVSDDELVRATARFQRALTRVGEVHPAVEVFRDASDLPPYQRAGLAVGALLWTEEDEPEIRQARLFDPAVPAGGPGFHHHHPRLDPTEGELVLAFLEGAEQVVSTSTVMEDVLDPDSPAVVPAGFRSDGRWVWSEAAGYYLRRYGLAPEPDLVRHIRSGPGRPAPLTAAGRHRVLAALYPPSPAGVAADRPVGADPGARS